MALQFFDMGRNAPTSKRERVGIATFRGETYFIKSDKPGQSTVEVVGRQTGKRYEVVYFGAKPKFEHLERVEIRALFRRKDEPETFTGNICTGLSWENLRPLRPQDELKTRELQELIVQGHVVELLQEFNISPSLGFIGHLFIVYDRTPITRVTGNLKIEPLIEDPRELLRIG